MSRFAFLNETTLRVYRYKYRSFGTPIIIIIVCIILFLVVIVPQFNQWLLMQQEIAISEQRVNILTNNLTFANKINGDNIDQYLQLVSKSLPTNKDFISVLTVISNAA